MNRWLLPDLHINKHTFAKFMTVERDVHVQDGETCPTFVASKLFLNPRLNFIIGFGQKIFFHTFSILATGLFDM